MIYKLSCMLFVVTVCFVVSILCMCILYIGRYLVQASCLLYHPFLMDKLDNNNKKYTNNKPIW